MPVYQYACTECGEQLEVRQSFTDASLTVCPVCEGRLRKVLNAVGVVFKGSGFYRNDSRAAAKGESGAAPVKEGVGTAKNGESTAPNPGGDGARGDGAAGDGSRSDGPVKKEPAAKPSGDKSSGPSGPSGGKPVPTAGR